MKHRMPFSQGERDAILDGFTLFAEDHPSPALDGILDLLLEQLQWSNEALVFQRWTYMGDGKPVEGQRCEVAVEFGKFENERRIEIGSYRQGGWDMETPRICDNRLAYAWRPMEEPPPISVATFRDRTRDAIDSLRKYWNEHPPSTPPAAPEGAAE